MYFRVGVFIVSIDYVLFIWIESQYIYIRNFLLSSSCSIRLLSMLLIILISSCHNTILTITSLNNFPPSIFLISTNLSFFPSFNLSSLITIFLSFFTSLLSSPIFITLLVYTSNLLLEGWCSGLPSFILFSISLLFLTGNIPKTSTSKTFSLLHCYFSILFSPSLTCLL